MCFSVEIIRDLNFLAKEFEAKIDKKAFLDLKDLSVKNHKVFKMPDEENRIFPNVFAPVLIKENNNRMILPMRYRIRPKGTKEEIPSKYNLYNARTDSLFTKNTWIKILKNTRGIVPFKRFFEWVITDGPKKKLGVFSPTGMEYMWAPCLTDEWISPDGETKIKSFAIITTDPPEEVLMAGHSRCPIFLKRDLIEEWISLKPLSNEKMLELLGEKEKVRFSFSLL
jgi:putative SOS response-associated peptidase YedK